jgi:hypothetical protein
MMTRSAVCALCIGFMLSPLFAQETKPAPETKLVQQTEGAPAQPVKPAEPETMSVVYFLDPASQTLKALPKDPAKVITKHSGLTGAKGYIQIPGAASSFRLKSGQDLVFVVKCTSPESYELYPFEKNKDKREALVSKAKAGFFGGVSSQKEGTVEVGISKYGEMSYKFVVKALEPGEYGFPVKWDIYNFGVDPK